MSDSRSLLNGNTGRQNIDGNAALPTRVPGPCCCHFAWKSWHPIREWIGLGHRNNHHRSQPTRNNYKQLYWKVSILRRSLSKCVGGRLPVYYRALPIDQIAALSQRLNVHLKLDESSGSTAADSSGNGNSGSLRRKRHFLHRR